MQNENVRKTHYKTFSKLYLEYLKVLLLLHKKEEFDRQKEFFETYFKSKISLKIKKNFDELKQIAKIKLV